MATWWNLVARADLGVPARALGGKDFAITNRQWYLLYRILKSVNAKHIDVLPQPEAFIPTQLAVLWGKCIDGMAAGNWLLVGRFDGTAVVADRIVHAADAGGMEYTHELTPLAQTPAYEWLLGFGQQLLSSPSGFFMTGKPRKGSSMSISLKKGDKADLAELAKTAGNNAGLTKVRVALGWDARSGAGEEFDLDASIIGLNENGVGVGAPWFVYYKQLASPGNAIVHQGDELTGATTGDDEQIIVDLSALPAEVTDLRIIVSIYDALSRGKQSFTNVDNAFVRIIDETTSTELCRFDLTEDTANGTNSIEFAKLYLHNGAWQFKVTTVERTDEVAGFLGQFGLA